MPSPSTYTPVAKIPGQPGKYYNSEGYVLLWINHSFRLEHVVIAEQTLGRRLKRDECVHHVNGIRSDNKRTNLVICKKIYHHQLHRRCYDRTGRWHTSSYQDPQAESFRRLRSGIPLSGPPVMSMYALDDVEVSIEGLDTVTLSTQREASPRKPLSSIKSILTRGSEN